MSRTYPPASATSSTAANGLAAPASPPVSRHSLTLPRRFCRLPWLDAVLAVPPWVPEGDLTFALHTREP